MRFEEGESQPGIGDATVGRFQSAALADELGGQNPIVQEAKDASLAGSRANERHLVEGRTGTYRQAPRHALKYPVLV
jgi:hypothetical protein